MRRVIGSFAVCFAIAALSGCGPVIWQRFTLNQPITKDQVAFIQNGETQLSEVARELGSPDEILNLKNRLVARVCDWFRGRGVDVRTGATVVEDVFFRLPPEVRLPAA